VIFLTDGLPTAGETNEMKIARHVEQVNTGNARLFAFGVGYDVNARLLDRLAEGNGGLSHFVNPDESVEAAVSDLYRSISRPVLSGVELAWEGSNIDRTYPRDLPDIFEGGQLICVGRYDRAGDATLTLTGSAGEGSQSFEYPLTLAAKGEPGDGAFIERIWATRRIGFLIDQIDLHGRSDELMNELVDLSTRYGILTPYTSFLAEEEVALGVTRDNTVRADQALQQLHETEGRAANLQRRAKQAYKLAGAGSAVSSAPSEADAAAELIDAEQTRRVQNIANRALFYKQGQWVDASLPEDAADQAVRLVQFSDEYFELSRQLSPLDNQLLTLDEPVLVHLAGQVYLISPADPSPE
jgi:Ca-activated chloride channel family protein